MKKIKKFAVVLIMLMLIAPAFAESTPVPGLSFFKLDNGLEVFVLENHTVPLTRIQISFRCGGITQTQETCGIFHLYEHMLFKGNEKYKTQTEFAAKMIEMGVAGYNGSTSEEFVEYHIQLPSAKTDEGLEFWSYAMKTPLFDAKELEKEKDVVCNEINGHLSNPFQPFVQMRTKVLYPKYPWRRDAGGYEKVIRAATRDMLLSIQKKYYIPNNAAIFVSGDVNPKEVLKTVKKYYGDWKKGPDPWATEQDPQLTPATEKPIYLVLPVPNIPAGRTQIIMYMRGPDVTRDPEATYAADVWGTLYKDPGAKFKTNVPKALPQIPHGNYMDAGYWTQRDGGSIEFSALALTKPNMTAAEVAKKFEKTIYDEVKKTVEDPNYFSKKEFNLVKKVLSDEKVLNLENPNSFIGKTLSFWWTSTSTDYYFNYLKNLDKVNKADIDKFLTKYVLDNVPIVMMIVNSEEYKKDKKSFDKEGFKVITKDNCFWWGDK